MTNRMKRIFDLVDKDLGEAVTGIGEVEWFQPLREHLDLLRGKHVIVAAGMKENAESYREIGVLDLAQRSELAESYALKVVHDIDRVTRSSDPESLASFELYVGEVRKAAAFGGAFCTLDDGLLKLCLREFHVSTPIERVADWLAEKAEDEA